MTQTRCTKLLMWKHLEEREEKPRDLVQKGLHYQRREP
jgi:hypothetical protein